MAGGAWQLSYVSSGRKAAKLHRSTLTLPTFSLPAPLPRPRPTRLSSAPGAWLVGHVGTVERLSHVIREREKTLGRSRLFVSVFFFLVLHTHRPARCGLCAGSRGGWQAARRRHAARARARGSAVRGAARVESETERDPPCMITPFEFV